MAVHVQIADGCPVEGEPRRRVASDASDAGQFLEVGVVVAQLRHVFHLGHATRPDGEEFAGHLGVVADRCTDVRLHGGAVRGDVPDDITFVHGDRSCLAATELGSFREDALENGGQVAGVFADQREHVTRCRLELERLLEVIEQSGVADGDHGLVGECLEHPCIVVVEGAYLEPPDLEVPECNPIRDERGGDAASDP